MFQIFITAPLQPPSFSKDTDMKDWKLKKEDLRLLFRALKYSIPYKLKFAFTLLCVISNIIFSIIYPIIWGRIIMEITQKNEELFVHNLVLLVVLYFLQTGIGFLQSYLFSYLNQNIVSDIKRDMYKKILNLPVKAFDKMTVGDFLSRINGDSFTIANIITSQLLDAFINILKVVFIGIGVFLINPILAAIVVFGFPFSYVIFLEFGKKLREKNSELLKLNDKFFSNTTESIQGIREIKSLGLKDKKLSIFIELINNINHKNIKISVINSISQVLSQLVTFISKLLILIVGCYFIFKGSLKIDIFIAFTIYSEQFSGALMGLTRLNFNIQQMITSLERIFHLMDNFSYSRESFGTRSFSVIEGELQFENVYFTYNEDNVILKDVTFSVKKNSKTAIIGPSGSGKTTIFNLLLNFYDVNSGIIKIDGINIKEFDEKSLRTNISVVRQEPFLFNTTIRENLMVGLEGVSEEEMIKACKDAYINDFIMSLPNSYDTVIGENGSSLSGGQKQRIAIARALLRKSKIILFDEATSALDNESQYYIEKAIDEVSKNHTVLVIAHKLSTIMNMNNIIVLEHGSIKGNGYHGELIKNNSVYKRLYQKELDVINQNFS